MATRATLAGIPLAGDPDSWGWELRYGVAPVVRAFRVTLRVAERLGEKLWDPVALELAPRGKKGETFGGLLVTDLQPDPSDPFLRVAVVADRRVLWGRRWIERDFNERRPTTRTRIVAAALAGLEAVAPELEWRESTLDAGQPWRALRALRSVLEGDSDEGLGEQVREAPTLSHDPVLPFVPLAAPGDAAVEALLGYAPGVDLYLDGSGAVVLRDTLAAPAPDVLPALARVQAGGVEPSDLRAGAPREVIVLFEPEPELRVALGEASVARDTPAAVNVLLSPDAAGVTVDGRLVGAGTPLALETAFGAWGAFGLRNRRLSLAILRANAFRPALVAEEFGGNPNVPPSPQAQGRVGAALDAFRVRWLLDRTFAARLRSIRAVRAAVVDRESGARAPAEVYSDHVRRASVRGLARQVAQPHQDMGWAVRGHAATLAASRLAPFRVAIEDARAGLFRLEPRLDPQGHAESVTLGYPEGGRIPGVDLRRPLLTGLRAYALWSEVALEAGWTASVILTVVPATPNDLRRLHRLRVTAAEVGARGSGPAVYVRIPAALATARVAWSDDQGEAIVGAVKGERAYPAAAVVNYTTLLEVALAAARGVYESWTPTPVGSPTVDFDAGLEPQGRLASVAHQVGADGSVRTRATFARLVRAPDLMRYLPPEVRAELLRQPAGAP